MNRNTSISLGSHLDKFVQGSISTGRYQNASEVIRTGLRLLETEEAKIKILKNAIEEGLDSGIAHEFNAEAHLQALKVKKNG